MPSKDKESKKISFWELITEWKITIPQLQREYAQGRRDETATQIRESLLNDIYNALMIPGNNMVLNFVYGKTDERNKVFTPIDGQQRLTTLFLLHLYVFLKNKDYGKMEILDHFSYRTRDTSRRFCNELCSLKDIDFNGEQIHSQITNQSWFTGNMKKDPTVESMLKMLDDIHRFFKHTDSIMISDKLVSEIDQPITFLWLEMEEFQKCDDLYIKMNARGKILSDFEIFKAKLQGSPILDKVLECGNLTDDEIQEKKVMFISQFNNQFIELFFSYFKIYGRKSDDGERMELIRQVEWDKLDDESKKNYILQPQLSIESADRALMDLIQNLMRDVFFIQLCNDTKNSRIYRDYYYNIVKMKSGSFFRFIEKAKLEELKINPNPEYPETIVYGVKMISHLLEILSEKYQKDETLSIDSALSKKYFDEEDILQNKISFYRDTTLKDNLITYGILAFIEKFGIPNSMDESIGYDYWKRIIFNLSEHANLRAAENVIAAMTFVYNLLERIKNNSKLEILEALSRSDGNDGGAALKLILPEEICKSKLIISDLHWEQLILEAENYYYDGSIGFLLRASSSSDDYENIIISEFERYFELTKQLFTGDKKQISSIGTKFEQALLCMNDKTVTIDSHDICTAHLKPGNDSFSWCFYMGDFKDYLQNHEKDGEIRKQLMLKELMKILITNQDKKKQQGQVPGTIEDQLMSIVTDMGDSASKVPGAEWKKIFLTANPLFNIAMNNDKFKNVVAFVGGEVLLLIKTTVRGYSMEMRTFQISQYAMESGKEVTLNLWKTSELVDAFRGFPRRYFTVKNHKIGYLGGEYYVLDDKNNISKKDEIGIKALIDSL